MAAGICYALAAGLVWGLIFVGPLWVPDYPAMLQSVGRYLALGVIALPLAWQQRRALALFSRRDWRQALWLALVGNLIYYCGVAGAVLRVGAPIATMVVGTLPVVIAISANLLYRHKEGRLSWPLIAMATVLMLSGLVLVNVEELSRSAVKPSFWQYLLGLGMAISAVLCWTWYALKNARWLKDNPLRSPSAWATAQGLATLPLSVIGYLLVALYLHHQLPHFSLPFGPRPWVFLPLMLLIGLLCSWLGTLFWNAASQRLPTVLMGPMASFEILTGLCYGFMLRQAWPGPLTVLGVFCMLAAIGVTVWAKHRQRLSP